MRVSKRLLISFTFLLLLIAVVGLAAWGAESYFSGPIPRSIKKQINFVVFYPTQSAGFIAEKKSFKYDSSQKLFTFIATGQGNSLTIAEQSTFEGFTDIPQAYDKLIETLNGYASFDSLYGKVSLTRPKEFNGQQSAVMNAKGTTMFVHPTTGDLSTDQWKTFFNGLEIIK